MQAGKNIDWYMPCCPLIIGNSGEVVISLVEWWKAGRLAFDTPEPPSSPNVGGPRKVPSLTPPRLAPDLRRPLIFAADPVRSYI